MRSYVSGPSQVPLLGETIGRCLDRITSAYPERDALVSCHQRLRLTYRQLRIEVERIARGLLAIGSTWRPCRDLEPELRGMAIVHTRWQRPAQSW